MACVLPRFENCREAGTRLYFSIGTPQCNFRLFIAFCASLRERMDSETRATSQARLPPSARRRYRKLAPRGHVSLYELQIIFRALP